MKKILMRSTAAGPDFSYAEGQVLSVGIEVSPAVAKAFVESGYAEEHDPDAPKAQRQTYGEALYGTAEHAAGHVHDPETAEESHKRGRR